MLLALKYRPVRFSDIVGQSQVQVILRRQVELGKVPPLLLFRGTWGTGKTSTARVLAAALNCPNSKEACGACDSCVSIQNGKSLAAWELDAASNGGIDDIRALKPKLMSAHKGKRLITFDEAQSLTDTAQQALLMLFENPPPDTHFIIATTNPQKLIEPIIDRAAPYDFYKISSKVVTDRLQAIAAVEGIEAEPALIAELVSQGDGSLRNSIMLLDQVSSVGISTLDQYADLLQASDFAPSLIANMSVGDQGAVAEIIDHELDTHGDYQFVIAEMVSTLRDVQALKHGGAIKPVGRRLAARRTLAQHVDMTLVVGALRLLWELKVRLHSDDQRTSIQLAASLMTELLSKGVHKEVEVSDPDKVMSMDELRRFAEG